jgi:uncharacterized membrane protein
MTDQASSSRLGGVLAYIGGLISGIIVILVERRDPFVRFHAMQSIVTFGTLLVAHLVLRALGLLGAIASVPFAIGVFCLWLALMIQAGRGERYHLPYLGAFAEHLLK